MRNLLHTAELLAPRDPMAAPAFARILVNSLILRGVELPSILQPSRAR